MTTPDQETPTAMESMIEQHRLAYLQKFLGLTEDESTHLVAILSQPTPKGWIKTRPIRGGATFAYVPGGRFIERFNDAFGHLWSFVVVDVMQLGNEVVAKGRFSVAIPGRTLTRRHPDGSEEIVQLEGVNLIKEQFGSAEIKRWANDGGGAAKHKAGDVLDLGNDYKAAATDAMKKCGTLLGVFADLYGADVDSSTSERPSETQLVAFFRRAERTELDEEKAEEWAAEKLGKPLSEADKDEVLGLTADLIDMGKKS